MNLNAWHILCICIYIYNIYVKTHGKAGVNITCLASGSAISALALSKHCWKLHFHIIAGSFLVQILYLLHKNIERQPNLLPPPLPILRCWSTIWAIRRMRQRPGWLTSETNMLLLGYPLEVQRLQPSRCNYSWKRYVCAGWNVQYTPWTTIMCSMPTFTSVDVTVSHVAEGFIPASVKTIHRCPLYQSTSCTCIFTLTQFNKQWTMPYSYIYIIRSETASFVIWWLYISFQQSVMGISLHLQVQSRVHCCHEGRQGHESVATSERAIRKNVCKR